MSTTANTVLEEPPAKRRPDQKPVERAENTAEGSGLDAWRVWRELEKASFAVLAYVPRDGTPRSSGVVYVATGRRLYVAVAPDSWKARQITSGQTVSLTVPVRRGGLLSLLVPIPPATISFRARTTVHSAGSLEIASLSSKLARLLPDTRRESSCVLELAPQGRFLTYGIGSSLRDMRNPQRSRMHVPVA